MSASCWLFACFFANCQANASVVGGWLGLVRRPQGSRQVARTHASARLLSRARCACGRCFSRAGCDGAFCMPCLRVSITSRSALATELTLVTLGGSGLAACPFKAWVAPAAEAYDDRTRGANADIDAMPFAHLIRGPSAHAGARFVSVVCGTTRSFSCIVCTCCARRPALGAILCANPKYEAPRVASCKQHNSCPRSVAERRMRRWLLLPPVTCLRPCCTLLITSIVCAQMNALKLAASSWTCSRTCPCLPL